MRRLFLVLLALSAVTYACSESTDGITPDGGLPVESDSDSGGADTSTTTPPKDGSVPVPDGDTSTSAVLINEISGGDEWVELVNSGTTAADLSGYFLADRDKDDGTPKLKDAVTFPAGTILSPRSYVVVRGGGLDGGGKACPDGGQSYCFNAEFGISNKNGETIFLLDPAQAVVGTVVYPIDGGAGGTTWGRLPSGDPSGTFQPTRETPGATNAAP